MRLTRLAQFTFAAALAVGASAQMLPQMQVVDPSGGVVGTIIAVKGDSVILKTDQHEVQLPKTSFTVDQGKALFGMTAAQLNAETAKAKAAATAAVAVGAQVYGSDGALAGQIEAADAELVTIKLTSGATVRLPRSSVGGSDKGAVLGMTAAQLAELASQAATPEQADTGQ